MCVRMHGRQVQPAVWHGMRGSGGPKELNLPRENDAKAMNAPSIVRARSVPSSAMETAVAATAAVNLAGDPQSVTLG